MDGKTINLLILNPGSTSTKVGVYQDETPVFVETLRHDAETIGQFKNIWEQYAFRKSAIAGVVRAKGWDFKQFTAIVSRGGIFKPIPSGVYDINQAMLDDAQSGIYGQHISSVGCQIAFDMGRELGIPAFMIDPPCCDELCDEARYTGLPQLKRRSMYHALNQKAIGRRLAKELGLEYPALRAVIAHLGGGISVAAHFLGRVIDVNNALDGDGPYSPERAGSLPAGDLIRMCFSGEYSEAQMLKMVSGKGGLLAHLNTTDGQEIEARIVNGDIKAKAVVEAMAYQISKEIGAMAAVLKGDVQAIALTGGLAHWQRLVKMISGSVNFIAPVHVYPGENEIEALALGALRALRGEEPVLKYT